MKQLSDLKKALVYDRVNKFGGAERVLLALKEVVGNELYTLVYSPHSASWAKGFNVFPSFFNNIPFLTTKHELLTPVAATGFESFRFDNYDLVVSVTSSDAKAIITRPETLHVCYCLTPPRYLWGMEDFYTRRPGFGFLNKIARKMFVWLLGYLQASDLVYASRPDAYIAISHEVQKRIKKIYGKDSMVVYPPVDFDFFSNVKKDNQGYYLVVSRLVPYKKISLVIKAFNSLGHRLLVVGDGSERDRLQSMAGKNIEFVGQVSDEKLRDYYAGAKALIFPQLEDFGITPLESQSTGTPVIAYGKGGAVETIIDKKTGLFFETQTSGAIMKAVEKFEKLEFYEADCRDNAKRFDKRQFLENFSKMILSIYNESKAK